MPLLQCLLVLLAGSVAEFEAGARIAFAPNGHTLAVSDLRGLTVFDAANPKVSIRLMGRQLRGEDALIVFSGDSRRVAESSGEDVLVWDVGTAKLVGTIHAAESVEMSLSHDGSQLAWCPRWDSSSGNMGNLGLNDVRSGSLIRKQRLGAADVKYSPDGKSLAIAGLDGTVRLLDPASFDERDHLTGTATHLLSLDFSPSGRSILAGGALVGSDRRSGSSVTSVWNLATKKIVWSALPEADRQTIHVQFIGEASVSRVSMILFFMGDGMDPKMREERFAIAPGERKPGLPEVRYSGDGRFAANLSNKGHTLEIHDLAKNQTRKIALSLVGNPKP